MRNSPSPHQLLITRGGFVGYATAFDVRPSFTRDYLDGDGRVYRRDVGPLIGTVQVTAGTKSITSSLKDVSPLIRE